MKLFLSLKIPRDGKQQNTMKNKIIVTLLLSFITVTGFAQFPLQGAGDKDFDALFTSKVYVTATGDSNMDKAMENAFKNYWKVTDSEMISGNDLEEMIQDDSKFFVTAVKVTLENSNPTMKNRTNKYLILTRGGYKNIDKVKAQNWIFSLPMDIWGAEGEITDMAYRMGPTIKMMNDAIQSIKSTGAKISAGKSAANYMEALYAGKSSLLKDKTLLINESHVQPEGWKPKGFMLTSEEMIFRASATKAEIEAAYPNKFEIVDNTTFNESIANHSAGNAVVIPVAFSNLIYFVIDTETYDCLYYGFQVSGLSLKAKAYTALGE